MLAALIAGFATSAGLIVAIGAQNAFVLRQGMARQYVGMVAIVCSVADAALIAAGVGGLGTIVQRHQGILEVVRVVGVAYLVIVALRSFMRSRQPERLLPAESDPGPRLAVMLAVLGLTFLNPHVYLDTVLLLGAVGASYGRSRWAFAAGAASASALWFFSLAFGARSLSRFMSSPRAWQILDVGIGLVMLAVAVGLATTPLR